MQKDTKHSEATKVKLSISSKKRWTPEQKAIASARWTPAVRALHGAKIKHINKRKKNEI